MQYYTFELDEASKEAYARFVHRMETIVTVQSPANGCQGLGLEVSKKGPPPEKPFNLELTVSQGLLGWNSCYVLYYVKNS
jgi:hypothetical protein